MFFNKVARRLAYVRGQAKQILPLRKENSLGRVLNLLRAEATISRAEQTAVMRGVTLHFRSYSSDLLVAHAWLKTPLAEQYATAKNAPGIIIDAGGHIGMAAITFAKSFPNKTVITLEPSPENFELMKKNVAPFRNIIPLNRALGPENTTLTLTDRTGNTDGFTIDTAEGAQGHSVEVITIPSLLAEFDETEIALLKMDIEGFELELLKDRPDWVSTPHLIACELHERYRTGSTRAYVNATEGRADYGFEGEMYFSLKA